MADTQKFRDRKFVLVLYPEDPTHAAAIEEGKDWYATGWTLNKETGLWEPPDYMK